MITLKLAARLAFTIDSRQRWRQVSVATAALLVTLSVLMAVATVHAAKASDARISARSPIWASGQGDARLRLSARGVSVTDLGQVPVVWLEPVAGHENDTAVVPPGLRSLPGPGEAVLSPGLVRHGLDASDFGFRPSSAGSGAGGTIGTDGVATLSEGWIYARPAEGRSLGQGGALLLSRGYPGQASRGISFETIPEVPRATESLLGASWMLIAPGGFLLFSSARAMSHVRDRRAQLLWHLGISTLRIRLLLATETVFLSLVGALPALVLWERVLGSITRVPLTDVHLKAGALHIPLAQGLLLALAVSLIAAAGAVVTSIRERSVRADTQTVRTWHAAPLLVAFLMMAFGPWLPPSSSLRLSLLFGGLLLTFVALPMALPAIVIRIASLLSRSGRASVWLAGRRLSLRSVSLSKPAAMVGALVFIAGAAFSIYDRLVATESNVGSNAPFSVFQVSWRDPQPEDLATAISAAHDAALLPASQSEDGQTSLHFHDCGQLAELIAQLPSAACSAEGQVLDRARRVFESQTGTLPVLTPAPARLDAGVYLFATKGTTELTVMRELAGSLPGVNINALGGASKSRDPRAGWMLAGWSWATLLLTLGLLREIGDRGLSSMSDSGQLLRAGLRRREISATYRWSLLPPVVVAIPIGFMGAVFFALLGYEIGITIQSLARIATVAGAVAVLAAATFGLVFRLQDRAFSAGQ